MTAPSPPQRSSATVTELTKKSLTALRRIEGQVRGVSRMVEEDRYCIDVATQIEAIRAALARVKADLLRQHLNHCVHEAFASKDTRARDRVIDELVDVSTARRQHYLVL